MEPLLRYREIFWDAFHKADLKSQTYKLIWEQLEPINNLLAGPLYSIYTQGNCNYIFQDKHRFPSIYSPDDFLNWCINLVEKYNSGIESIIPHDGIEKEDQTLLVYQTDLKMELSDLAYCIVSVQAQRARNMTGPE